MLSEIKQFSRDNLRKTVTMVTRLDGVQCVETRDEFGNMYSRELNSTPPSNGYVLDFKPDLQIGQILPDLLLGTLNVIECKVVPSAPFNDAFQMERSIYYIPAMFPRVDMSPQTS